MKPYKTLSYFLLLVALCCSLRSQTKPAESQSESARKFVQEFYDWYAPGVAKATGEHKGVDWETRASDFDPTLVRALREDEEAEAKAEGEFVGIDFDPFLASQDPCAPYKARDVVLKGNHYFVAVDIACEHFTATSKPTVIAELVQNNGHWIFLNFHYPPPTKDDLLNILKTLSNLRKQPSKK
jgi:hypothetical protein